MRKLCRNRLQVQKKKSALGQEGNFKQTQKLCMPFLRFKKDKVPAVGVQALDLKLPFCEIEVLKENLELIKRQLGLDRLEVLSATDADAIEKAWNHAILLKSNPHPQEILVQGRS
ncbi:unnamed protein product [Fraxinus pennsylvanica]|uniref:Uncharacterized protein n=1 Tax=Fraxinus pennsylvanica TaxID=56036 RepID=A0AAD2DT17_9LAMI|nr:unnamed protein product [Fraxinus pennsylvanica]